MTSPTDAQMAEIRERDAQDLPSKSVQRRLDVVSPRFAAALIDRRTLLAIIDKMRAEVRCPDCNDTRRVDTELGRITCPMCVRGGAE